MYFCGGGEEQVAPLALAREGSIVKVLCIRGGYGLIRRLNDLGIREGSLLKVVKSMGAGPVIVHLLDSNSLSVIGRRIALGFGVAMKIIVKEVE